MASGWQGKILDVDLTTGAVGTRDSLALARSYLGGRMLAARIAWEEVPPRCDPCSPENPIIIATGPLTGTLAPTSGRTIMASVSPRTYPFPWYTHSTLGGWFGPALKYAGYDALIIRGRAPSPVYLSIRDGEVSLREAADLWGLGTREVQLRLKGQHGANAQILAIGPAGENLVRFATVQHSEENAAGHSGFGAVWGAKRLKAVVVQGTGGVSVAAPEALLREALSLRSLNTPCHAPLFEKEMHGRRPVCSQACTCNCHVAGYSRTGDGRLQPEFCIGPIWTGDGMALTAYAGGGVRVPAGANFPGKDPALHALCNDLGLDLWFRLVMQPWLQRCYELGLREIRGYAIAPTDAAWFEGLMQQVAHRQGLGAILADDLCRAMDELEGELPEELVALGRELEFDFGFPAHREGRFWDEEPLPFWAISAMMHASEGRDPTIGAHQSSLLLADFQLADPELARRQFRGLSEKVWGDANALEPTFEGKAPVAIWSQHQHLLVDSLPLCDFAFPQLVRSMTGLEEWRSAEDISGDLDIDRRLLAAVTGIAYTRGDLDLAAERAATLERALLARAGRSRLLEEGLAPHFRLPCRADGTSIDQAGFSRLLDEYFAARRWDLEFGWPTDALLQHLGLDELIPELQTLRSQASP